VKNLTVTQQLWELSPQSWQI